MSVATQHHASFSERAGAFLVDGLVSVAVIYTSVLISIPVSRGLGLEADSPGAAATWLALAAIAVLAYFTAGYARGKTVGLHVCNLRMTRPPGAWPPEPWRALARAAESVAFLAACLALFVYGFSDEPADGYGTGDALAVGIAGIVFVLGLAGRLWMLRDARGRTLQDRLAGVVVIDVSEQAVARDGSTRGPSPA
jgi:uncharacterized RDD family membrane protein YckC